jgi:hypothetical protein
MQAKYQIESVFTQAQREHIISEKVSHHNLDPAAKKFTVYDRIPGQEDLFPIIELPIDLPIYRMANGRTKAYQEEYIEKEKLSTDFFSRGAENEQAQNVQHGLLVELANRDVEGSIANIVDVLRERGQTEPVLVSPSGVVLNGNRRLAAMREIFAQDRTAHRNFENIKVAVLPPMSEKEEIVFETRLQMQRATKLDYSWVAQSMVIETLQDRGLEDSDIAEFMNTKESDVKIRLQALLEGRRFLREWLGKPSSYGLLLDKEQIFRDLPKKIARKPDSYQEAARKIQWCLISGQSELDTRIYAVSNKVLTRIPEIVERVNVEETVEEPLEGDIFDFSAQSEDRKLAAFASAVNNLESGKTLRELVVETALDIYREDEDDRTAKSPLLTITKANSLLGSVDLNLASMETFEQLEGQLKSIESTCKKLLRFLKTKN